MDEPEFATVDGYGGEAESSPEDRFGREEARPTSVADVLERLKAAGHWHDEEGEGDSDISSLGPASMPAPAGCRSEGSAESAGAEDDASIQKYLDGLLHRVRGQQDVPPPLGLEEVTPHVQCEVGIPAARRVAEPAPYVRREVAPEARVGLDAMRKVANESARSAIETHARKVAVEQIRSSWAFAALSVFGVFWGTAAWSVLAKSSPLLGRVGAGIGYGMAGVFTLLAVVHRFRGRKPEPESEPPLADEPSR